MILLWRTARNPILPPQRKDPQDNKLRLFTVVYFARFSSQQWQLSVDSKEWKKNEEKRIKGTSRIKMEKEFESV